MNAFIFAFLIWGNYIIGSVWFAVHHCNKTKVVGRLNIYNGTKQYGNFPNWHVTPVKPIKRKLKARWKIVYDSN